MSSSCPRSVALEVADAAEATGNHAEAARIRAAELLADGRARYDAQCDAANRGRSSVADLYYRNWKGDNAGMAGCRGW
jgi:hypothetical protein